MFRRRRFIQSAVYGAASGAAFSLAYQSSAFSTNFASTTVDYGTLAYAAGATRTIVAIGYLASTSTQTVTGVTIGGVSLAQVSGAYVQQGAGFTPCVDIWESTGSLSGSSGDVQVTYSAVVQNGGESAVALYSLTTTTPTSSAANTATQAFSSSVANTLNIPAGGGAICLIKPANGNAITSITNGSVDVAIGSTNMTFGHSTTTGASTTLTANLGTSDVLAMSSAAWGP